MGVGAFQFSGGKKRHVHARSRKEIGYDGFWQVFSAFLWLQLYSVPITGISVPQWAHAS